jgi:galactokinase
MTGAGFGGSAVALVQGSEVMDFIKFVSSAYDDQAGMGATFLVTSATDGASLMHPE